VLAKKPDERKGRWKNKFEKVPYLNSSLFEPSSLEDDLEGVESLDSTLELEILKSTKLLDGNKPHKGKLRTIEYLFRFLDSYNFASEGTDEEQEDRKALINASVLGLIFEKINGYKDGSFFTPGFITMYMCRETLRRAVLQKFNEKYTWKCENLDDLYNHLNKTTKNILIYNTVIDDLKICDPAVGSGHFLVSALNELIAIKSELGILADKTGKVLPVSVKVANDELLVEENNETIFEYAAPAGKTGKTENQRVQETLFHEKEKLIEHCLFGVDINGNSVKICRLRLWIELLKNAYYTEESGYTQLETLPNIDINIKRGNSLISRFALDSDLSTVFKQQKFSYDTYRLAVESYKTAPSKQAKEGLLKLINEIKEQFKTTFYNNDPLVKQLSNLRGQLALLEQDMDLFGKRIRDEKEVEIQKKRLKQSIANHEEKIQDIKNSKIYRNAFEWRFEFPEVMDKNGNFVGFDVVIGNPPYGVKLHSEFKDYFSKYYKSFQGNHEVYFYFIELAEKILSSKAFTAYISPDTWINIPQGKKIRELVLDSFSVQQIVKLPTKVFEDVSINAIITFLKHNTSNELCDVIIFESNDSLEKILSNNITRRQVNVNNWIKTEDKQFMILQHDTIFSIVEKIGSKGIKAERFLDVSQGIIPYSKENQDEKTVKERLFHSNKKLSKEYGPWIQGRAITRYNINLENCEYLKYGNWLHRSRNRKYFQGERILVQEITGGNPPRISATFHDDILYHDPGIISCINTSTILDIKYILSYCHGIMLNALQKE